jgi:hypothetical protein
MKPGKNNGFNRILLFPKFKNKSLTDVFLYLKFTSGIE